MLTSVLAAISVEGVTEDDPNVLASFVVVLATVVPAKVDVKVLCSVVIGSVGTVVLCAVVLWSTVVKSEGNVLFGDVV